MTRPPEFRSPQEGDSGLPLFEYARARKTDPETSHEAAASVKVPPLERKILSAITALGDATSLEVSDYLGIPRVTISPRFKPMGRKGLIRRTGETRFSDTGRRSEVWEASR